MRVLLAEDELHDEWFSQLGKSTTFHIAMALVTKTGMDLVTASLESQLESGGVGRVLVGTDLPTDPQALTMLHALERKFPEQIAVRRYGSDSKRFFHPKFSVFTQGRNRKTAILGSSNLTQGGFGENIEANVLLDSASEINKLLKFFQLLFLSRYSEPISQSWLNAYRKQWKDRKAAVTALKRSRKKAAGIKVKQPDTRPLPIRIKGAKFVFTGGIKNGWNRQTALRRVLQCGGVTGDSWESVRSADCLVEGTINPYYESTLKLEAAREHNIPIMSADEFFAVYENEMKLRGKRRAARD